MRVREVGGRHRVAGIESAIGTPTRCRRLPHGTAAEANDEDTSGDRRAPVGATLVASLFYVTETAGLEKPAPLSNSRFKPRLASYPRPRVLNLIINTNSLDSTDFEAALFV